MYYLSKIIITVFFSVILTSQLFSIKKPKIVSGISSHSNYNIIEDTDEIYPSTLQDHFYLKCEEKLADFFWFIYKTDFYIINYNKYSSCLEDLQSYIYNNSLTLIFNPGKNNKLSFLCKPMLYYKYGEIYLKFLGRFQYKLSIKHFSFSVGYSYLHTYKEDELFYHNFVTSFYWSLPKKEFVKFKSLISVYLQHYDDNYDSNYEKLDEKPVLKSVKFSFEVALDFNKIDFEEIFKNDVDDDFFEYE